MFIPECQKKGLKKQWRSHVGLSYGENQTVILVKNNVIAITDASVGINKIL